MHQTTLSVYIGVLKNVTIGPTPPPAVVNRFNSSAERSTRPPKWRRNMSLAIRTLICLLLSVSLLSGCYRKPVRHLASDAALIKAGQSSREDVLTFLGEPDEQIIIQEGVEKWVFKEYENSALKSAPVVGKYFGKPDYGTVTVIIKDNTVVKCVYGAYDHEEMGWADDFHWQEQPK